MDRRVCLKSIGMLVGGSFIKLPSWGFGLGGNKLRVALVGTGIRGTGFWGKSLVEKYSNILEFVGLCDINPGRLEYAKKYIQVNCPIYLDFKKMISETHPDLVIVTTKDSTHHEFSVQCLEMGCDVLTEKPLTTDEEKCQQIIDADRNSDKNLIIGFNYRWSPYSTKIKELLMQGAIGKIVSVDFHWYLNIYHGASYFRRWHGLRESSGTLWVHKATHHFDLLNWWLDSDPREVYAYGALEHYGSNSPYRGENCRICSHKQECKFFWDITRNQRLMDLYVAHEKHDGYIRDNCLFRKEIDIYDKMSAQIKYMNDIIVNYSLTTYSPFEGWRIAFNGMDGRLEAWQDIPYQRNVSVDQSQLHAAEMDQTKKEEVRSEPIIVHKLWKDFNIVPAAFQRGGHGGGDQRLHEQIFTHPGQKDPYQRAAGIRDGAMSCLIGIAARKSIESRRPVRIAELTDLEPRVKKM